MQLSALDSADEVTKDISNGIVQPQPAGEVELVSTRQDGLATSAVKPAGQVLRLSGVGKVTTSTIVGLPGNAHD